jgi:DNA replication initiation complex subunit (GINS family)
MLTYNDLYEILRKEKYNDNLQLLPKSFVEDVAVYLSEKKEESSKEGDFFIGSTGKTKKQFENSIAIFKEIMLRRKKKLLNLVFIAAETGVMKRDYDNMLPFERELFEKFVKAFEETDKELLRVLGAKKADESKKNRMIIFNQNVEQFVDLNGISTGPFVSGELANLDADVATILVSGGKASFVDEE